MNNQTFTISRRKVLAGLGTVGLASAGAGLGTTAFFSDEEVVSAELRAGRLDLKLDYRSTYNPWLDPDEIEARKGQLLNGNNFATIDGDDMNIVVGQQPDLRTDEGQAVSGDDWPVLTFNLDACTVEDAADLDAELTTYNDANGTSFAAVDDGEEGYVGSTVAPYVDGETGVMFQLTDVKPKDEGETTISLHVCDNPAYLWLQTAELIDEDADIVEPEDEAGDTGEGAYEFGELDDYIYVEAWYDADCDNLHGDTEVYLYRGSLAGLVDAASTGMPFDPIVDAIGGGGDNQGEVVNGATLISVPGNPTCEDLQVPDDPDLGFTSLGGVKIDESDLVEGDTYDLLDEDGNKIGEVTIDNFVTNDEGEVVSLDWSSDVVICAVSMKGGQAGANVYYYGDGSQSGSALVTPNNPNDKPAGLSHINFCVCDTNGGGPDPEGEPGVCIEGVTCIAFRWYLPCFMGDADFFDSIPDGDAQYTAMQDEIVSKFGLTDASEIDVNVVQTDAYSFDMKFAAIQCRHNMDNVNPFPQNGVVGPLDTTDGGS